MKLIDMRLIIICSSTIVLGIILSLLIRMYVKGFTRGAKVVRAILKIEKPLLLLLFLVTLYIIVLYFKLPFMQTIDKGFKIAFVIVGTYLMYQIVDVIFSILRSRLVGRVESRLYEAVVTFSGRITKFIVVIAGMAGIVRVAGYDIKGLVAGVGITGLAFAFAARDVLANIIAGFFILADRPFIIGDRIQVGDFLGDVIDIGLRTTKIKTLEERIVVIPNSKIASSELINFTLPMPPMKVFIDIGVAYGSDIVKVKQVLLECARDAQYVLDEPSPQVYFMKFADFALNFRLIVWVKEPRYQWDVVDEINSLIDTKFREAGITIPFPITTVYLECTPKDKAQPGS